MVANDAENVRFEFIPIEFFLLGDGEVIRPVEDAGHALQLEQLDSKGRDIRVFPR